MFWRKSNVRGQFWARKLVGEPERKNDQAGASSEVCNSTTTTTLINSTRTTDPYPASSFNLNHVASRWMPVTSTRSGRGSWCTSSPTQVAGVTTQIRKMIEQLLYPSQRFLQNHLTKSRGLILRVVTSPMLLRRANCKRKPSQQKQCLCLCPFFTVPCAHFSSLLSSLFCSLLFFVLCYFHCFVRKEKNIHFFIAARTSGCSGASSWELLRKLFLAPYTIRLLALHKQGNTIFL